jgi:peptidoglycan-associated lipoprotein
MAHGVSRNLALSFIALFLALASGACKSAPVAEAPVTTPPEFGSGNAAKPAEKVDETSGFQDAQPSDVSLRDAGSSSADKLNAQGVLKRVHFDFDRYDLRPDAIRTLGDDAATIKQHAQFKVRIEGHCDERGTVEYNLALGEKRARAARDYLVSIGTPAGRLSIVSFGKERALDPGHNEEAWALNRRAELLFVSE